MRHTRSCLPKYSNHNSFGRVLCRATTGVGEAGGGKGHNGGVFEWTSSVFEKHEGFLQSILYPGYVLLPAPYPHVSESMTVDISQILHGLLRRLSQCRDRWLLRHNPSSFREEDSAQLLSAELPVRLGRRKDRVRCTEVMISSCFGRALFLLFICTIIDKSALLRHKMCLYVCTTYLCHPCIICLL